MRGRLLYLCVGGGTDLAPAPMPMRLSARQVPRRRSQILGLEDGRSGLDLPGGQIGVRLLCVEGESVLEDGERGWIRLEGESA